MFQKLDHFVANAQIPVCILGNLETSEFLLLAFAELQEGVPVRGMCFVGVLGIFEGWPRAELVEPIEPEDAGALARAYLGHLGIVKPDERRTH